MPPIAVIQRDSRELGRRAAQLLLRGMVDTAEPEHVLLPTTFLPTASCAPPRATG